MSDEWCGVGVGELAAGYRDGSFSPVEVVGAVLERIERLNPQLNAVLTVLGEQAGQAAAAASLQLAAGVDLGPLHGVPVTVKDNIDIAGVRTSCASRVLEDAPVAEVDAWVVRRLRSAGAVVVGKTNLSEFAFGDSDPDGPFGVVQNPRGLGRQSGTSSSGAGSSVAAGLGAVAIGTDTGGSVRHPAAVCGVPGLKPTFGRLPLDGVVPNSPHLDHLGVLARSVADLATSFQILTEGRPTHGGGVPPWPFEPDRPADALRIGFVAELPGHVAHPRAIELLEEARADLAGLTAGVVPVDLPEHEVERSWRASRDLSPVDLCLYHARHADREHLYHEAFRTRVSHGLTVSGMDYARARSEQDHYRAVLGALLAACDVIAIPANLYPAPPHGQEEVDTPSGPLPVRNVNSRYDKLGSLSGFPALIVPIGDVGGLPVSMQLLTAPDREERLFAVAGALEAARGPLAASWGIEPQSA